MAIPLEKFVQQLEDSGILAGDTLKDFLPPKASPKSAEELALELVRKKKLTKYQAEEVSKGKGKLLVLGNYLLMEKIGAGGMGQVFKARHRRMDRLVAIKLLSTALTKDAAAIARFEREVKAAAKLRHPNIIAADDADQANGIHFLVMEFVDGSDLSAMVKKTGPLPVDQAVNYILQAARGLEFAHAEGVVHRDIKPANLLLDKKGTIKILDMGLARIHGEAGQAELTSTGAVMGTVDYMAPEQALNTKTADARADIYALGCSLYYLLTGRATYDGDTLMAKLLAHRDQPIPSLRTIRVEVPEQVDVIFRKMVAKKVEDRYQTMADVIAALESWGSGQSKTFAVESSDAGQTVSGRDKSVSSRTSTLSQATQKEAASSSASKTIASFEESNFTDFLDNISATPTKPTRAKMLPKKPVAKGKNTFVKDQKQLVLIGGAILGVMILLAGVVINMKTKDEDGTLVVTVNEPDAKVEVLNDKDTVDITRKVEKGPITITVVPGKHRLRVQKDGFEIFTDNFEIKSGKSESITAELKPLKKSAVAASSWHGWPADSPKPAIAPFNASDASQHQQAWAKYLNVPVEYTNSIGIKFRLIPPGEFLMGSSEEQIEAAVKVAKEYEHKADPGVAELIRATEDSIRVTEQPQHQVVITRPFMMGITEVTIGQFKKFAAATGYQTEAEKVELAFKAAGEQPPAGAWNGTYLTGLRSGANDDFPAMRLTWNDSVAFCIWLSSEAKLALPYDGTLGKWMEPTGKSYHLPTEAQYEYACRAGTTTQYSFGDDPKRLADFLWNQQKEVGLRPPNAFGLHDLQGSAWEWCQDWFDEKWYEKSPTIDPIGPFSGSHRVARGGSWHPDETFCRSAHRLKLAPTENYFHYGFRVALTVDAVRQMTDIKGPAMPNAEPDANTKKKLAFEFPGFDQ